MHDALTASFLRYRPALIRWLRATFPNACAELARDAAQEAYTVALERPALFQSALARGERDLRRLLRCVAFRQLRAAVCRGDRRQRQVDVYQELDALARPPGQEHAAGLGRRVRWLIDTATATYAGDHGPALRVALEEKVLTGATDLELARKHAIPREYLNRAKRYVQRGVWEGALCA